MQTEFLTLENNSKSDIQKLKSDYEELMQIHNSQPSRKEDLELIDKLKKKIKQLESSN